MKDRVAAFHLTPMEKRMLGMRAAGMDVAAIAAEMACQRQNVSRNLLNARNKLLVNTEAEAIEKWKRQS